MVDPKPTFGEHSLHRRLYKWSGMAEGDFMLMVQLTSDTVLDAAYDWLCRRRREYPSHANIWDFRRSWSREKESIRVEFATCWVTCRSGWRTAYDSMRNRMK